ncbi:unnamed protein product [Sphenostylis stenocarpa]|uniref:Uncharacterized protein n=1 Tax=Sphenostylis stenocarpa TaxID=92480 RepID=A0AA86RL37_9FABA|nr:unnamed protein product [Sphenostylis stenocarpa]
MSCFNPEKPTISMLPPTTLGYQKLRHDEARSRFRFKRVPLRRRLRLKVPSLRKLWRKRRRLVSSMRVSYAKVLKRFRDGQVHFGELFAGNYLFMHVNPTSLNSLQRDLSLPTIP